MQLLNYNNYYLSLIVTPLKCEGSIDFDPFGGIKLPSPDNWQQTLQNLDILNDLKTAESGIDEAVGYMSIFGSSDSPFGPCREEIINPTDQNSVASLPIGLKYDTCLPPTLSLLEMERVQ